jgi:hypothetical protein
VRWPVIAREHDDGVLVEAELLDLVKDAADAAVHARGHCGVGGPRVPAGQVAVLAPVRWVVPLAQVLRERVLRHLQRHVRDGEGHVQEERPVLVVLDELEGLGLEQVVRVLPAPECTVVVQPLAPIVAPQVSRIMVVGVALAVEAVEQIEPLLARIALGAGTTQPPLADGGGGVALLLEEVVPPRPTFCRVGTPTSMVLRRPRVKRMPIYHVVSGGPQPADCAFFP